MSPSVQYKHKIKTRFSVNDIYDWGTQNIEISGWEAYRWRKVGENR